MSLDCRFPGKKHHSKNYATLQSSSLSANTSPINASSIKKVSVIPKKHSDNFVLNMKPT